MIGRMKIQEIRGSAELKLGQQFEIRAFHDALLEEGALPLDLLDVRMNRWMDTFKPASEKQSVVRRRKPK